MIIRCTKTFTPNDGDHFIINHDMRDSMDIGNEYVVYGLRIAKEATYFVIFDDHLLNVPSQLFEIIEGSVSPLWVVKSHEDRRLTFWPPLFYEEDFWENFSEWEDRERNSFYELQKHFPPQVEYNNSDR